MAAVVALAWWFVGHMWVGGLRGRLSGQMGMLFMETPLRLTCLWRGPGDAEQRCAWGSGSRPGEAPGLHGACPQGSEPEVHQDDGRQVPTCRPSLAPALRDSSGWQPARVDARESFVTAKIGWLLPYT